MIKRFRERLLGNNNVGQICNLPFKRELSKNVGTPSYQEIKGVKHYFDDKEV